MLPIWDIEIGRFETISFNGFFYKFKNNYHYRLYKKICFTVTIILHKKYEVDETSAFEHPIDNQLLFRIYIIT